MATKCNQTIIYLCNALDDLTKQERNIKSNSPAATKKVFDLIDAMRGVGHRVFVLSLGRGKQDYRWKYHRPKVCKFKSTPLIYSGFYRVAILTHVVTMVSLVFLMFRLSELKGRKCLIAYNRTYHYLPALIFAKFLGFKCIIDIEDGFDNLDAALLKKLGDIILTKVYDFLCNQGAILANTDLALHTSIKNTYVCYGVVHKNIVSCKKWDENSLSIIFSGTHFEETGIKLFFDAIRCLKKNFPLELKKLHFHVTGKILDGKYERLILSDAFNDCVKYHGMLSREAYLEILEKCNIGLSLRLSDAEMSHTTFPSKAIEYLENTLLLVTTPVSDLPKILSDDSAIFIDKETPEFLAEILVNILSDISLAKKKARHGNIYINEKLDPVLIGRELTLFLSGCSGYEDYSDT